MEISFHLVNMIFLNHISHAVETNRKSYLLGFHRGVAQLASASALGADSPSTHPSNNLRFSSHFVGFSRVTDCGDSITLGLTAAAHSFSSSSSGVSTCPGIEAALGCAPGASFLDGPGTLTRIRVSGFLFSNLKRERVARLSAGIFLFRGDRYQT